jgi:hypothetical protein
LKQTGRRKVSIRGEGEVLALRTPTRRSLKIDLSGFNTNRCPPGVRAQEPFIISVYRRCISAGVTCSMLWPMSHSWPKHESA